MSTKEAKKTPPTEPTKEPTKADKEPELERATATTTTNEDEADPKAVDVEELIDMNTFEQLLDMDDEEDHEFSLSIVLNYFEQAEATFKDMDQALDKHDLMELSRLGHFLKGSSAAIGLKKVKATCEKIQNIGNRQDDEGSSGTLDPQEAIKRIRKLLPQVKAEYNEAEDYLKAFYNTDGLAAETR